MSKSRQLITQQQLARRKHGSAGCHLLKQFSNVAAVIDKSLGNQKARSVAHLLLRFQVVNNPLTPRFQVRGALGKPYFPAFSLTPFNIPPHLVDPILL
ncbi:hypothetical protein J6590_025306 [Homalodisca vitripennis]|nr:hypothetical protein J6590_025306 [Homalodisca vitripennis]